MVNYLPHLAAINPKSTSTPVHIVFDVLRAQGGGPGQNEILAKGPDKFLNNLASMIISFHDRRFAAQGDVSNMFNAVHLVKADWFLQCFLWRRMDEARELDTHQLASTTWEYSRQEVLQ